MIKTFSFLLIAWFSVPCFSQSIEGIILDSRTSESLTGATVVIKGTTTGVVSDMNGKFKLQLTKPLPVILQISYLGYESREIEITSLSKPIKILLKEEESELKEVVIKDTRLTAKQKEAPLTVESLDVIAIKETPASNFYEGLGHLKGVDITAASLGFRIINTRGFNSTSPVRSLQIIDGVDNQAPGLNFSLGNFLGASELDIQRAEIIVGASSAIYGPNAFNGVVSMTTKNPFLHKGLSVQTKVGERGLFEGAVRWAQVFRNKDNKEKLAWKMNLFFMRANDWEADNMEPTPQSFVGKNNWGGYDAVNRYGDENFNFQSNNFTSLNQRFQNPGLGIIHRTGYLEKDLVDYNTQNVKVNTALHYRIKKDIELIYAFNLGSGTTVYQGDNRYSLKDILFLQNRLEIRKENKYFLRAYSTHEDAGKSFDAVFTAFILQQTAKSDEQWSKDYANFYKSKIVPRVRNLPGYPEFVPGSPYDFDSAQRVMERFSDSMVRWHQITRDTADRFQVGTIYLGWLDRYQPGTARFDSMAAVITSRTFTEGGTRFYDKSSLYHLHGERKFESAMADLTVGGNFRLYRPDSRGTIFEDTAGRIITNTEFGIYAAAEKRYFLEKLKVMAAARMDKNRNFNYVFSPAASLIYLPDPNNTYRVTFTSAIRNPTLQDQYLYYNVGRAILLGNLNGFEKLYTIESLIKFASSQNLNDLDSFSVAPVRPEKVKTVEVGYRGILFNAIQVDAGYYFSYYTDFLGFKLGATSLIDYSINRITSAQAYRVTANADSYVTTQGASIGINYFFKRYYTVSGNYSWNRLNKKESEDPIIPAFNTPENKFNIGISGREIFSEIGLLHSISEKLPVIRLKNFGFNVNYKWVQGFVFEGSPQFTGFVPNYDMVDFQVNQKIDKWHTTFKLGASNLFNNKQFQVFGGPRIGRLAYFSVLVELN